MKLWVKILIVVVLVIIAYGIYDYFYLQKAHSTFDEYYKFRSCQELVSKENDFGICRLSDGSTIKIVKYNGKWYLDGDLPTGGFLDF